VILTHLGVTGAASNALLGNDRVQCVNSALWLSAAPAMARVEFSYSDLGLGGAGNRSGPVEVTQAPDSVLVLVAASTAADRFSVPPGHALPAGRFVEQGNDGVAHEIVAVQGGVAEVDPPFDAPLPAGSILFVYLSEDVSDNPALGVGAGWIDAGDPTERDPDSSTTDIGVLGGRLAEFRPAPERPLPFVVSHAEPGPGPAGGAVTEVQVDFTRDVDPASVDSTSMVLRNNASVVPGQFTVTGFRVVFVPDQPLAAGTLEVQILGTIRDVDLISLDLPIRFRVDLP